MIWLLCGFLGLIILILGIKIYLLRKSAWEISREFSDKLNHDTNTLITTSTQDKAMNFLADNLNTQLKELQRQRHRYVQGDLELKNAITNISHDLRTPLTAISGYLDLLEDEELNEKARRYTKIIKNRTNALEQLTEELFRYSVIISPEYENKRESVCVNTILEESILGFYAALQERGITPKIHITETKIVRDLNPASLSRIFSNLIHNAIKYSDKDLSVTLTDEGKIIFSNSARNLNEVLVERLFDRFYTVECARKSTGLGLSIARILTEQIGGTIEAKYENHRLWIFIFLPP